MRRRLRLLPALASAVVGRVRAAPGSYGGEALLNLARLGYPGRTFAVNPRRAAVHGVRAYPALEDLPEAPDAVVVAIPAGDAPGVVARARAMGCGGAVVFAAGFAEAREAELQARAGGRRGRAAGVRARTATGSSRCPTASRCGATRSSRARPGPVALISQSGQRRGQRARLAARAAAAHRRLVRQPGGARRRRLPRGAVERDGVRSVALYLEDDGDGARWCAALERCARGRHRRRGAEGGPLARGRGRGRRPHGRARRRPARLPRAVRGVRRRLGRGPARPAGAGEGAGGAAPRAAARARAAPRRGGHDVLRRRLRGRGRPRGRARRRAPALAPATIARLEAVLPAAATAANPLDYTSLLWDEPDEAAGADRGARATTRASGGCWCSTTRRSPARTGRRSSTRCGRGATADVTVASTLPELVVRRARSPGCAAGCRAMRARRDAAARSPTRSGRRPDARGGRGQGSSCATAGIDVVPDGARRPTTPSPTWRELGGPVAIKRHRRDAQGARRAASCSTSTTRPSVREAEQRLGPPTLVERMAPRGIEVLVAIRRDGLVPVLVVGAGGVHTELLDDVAVDPAARRRTARSTEALATLRTPIPPDPIARLAVALQTASARPDRAQPRDRPRDTTPWRSTRWPTRRSTDERDRGEAGGGRSARADQRAGRARPGTR